MERIDVAKLLKDCPSGMELDSTMYENIVFDKIIEDDKKYPIRVIRTEDGSNSFRISLTKYGQYSDIDSAKCIIYPKGKTTWEGFVPPCKFKDGDIIASLNTSIYIFTNCSSTVNGYFFSPCGLIADRNGENHHFKADTISISVDNMRLATEEEKQKLFDAIKANGYEWNPERKTLEKLTESKEDTDDKIVMSGIYFDRENYADEVELHLGNYEIEIRDGKTYAVFKNQESKNSKPRFKVGDKIKHKNTVLTIINVKTNSYIVEDEPDNFGILVFSQQDKWELVNEPRFKVGDRVKSIFNNYQYDIKELTDTHYTLVEVESKFKYTEPIINDKNWELVNEPKFKVGDKIINKSLNIFNPIEITAVTPRIYTFTNGSFQYVETIDKDYELVIDKPKFKVGDRIRYVGDDFPIKIIDIKDNQYHIECFCDKHNVYKNGIIPVSKQDNYLLITKFDISTLKPFDKVLVRDDNDYEWVNAFFGFYDTDTTEKYPFVASGCRWAQCIPYLGNEHLLGTTNDCDEYFNLIS